MLLFVAVIAPVPETVKLLLPAMPSALPRRLKVCPFRASVPEAPAVMNSESTAWLPLAKVSVPAL